MPDGGMGVQLAGSRAHRRHGHAACWISRPPAAELDAVPDGGQGGHIPRSWRGQRRGATPPWPGAGRKARIGCLVARALTEDEKGWGNDPWRARRVQRAGAMPPHPGAGQKAKKPSCWDLGGGRGSLRRRRGGVEETDCTAAARSRTEGEDARRNNCGRELCPLAVDR
jgi:hypothetical protein